MYKDIDHGINYIGKHKVKQSEWSLKGMWLNKDGLSAKWNIIE